MFHEERLGAFQRVTDALQGSMRVLGVLGGFGGMLQGVERKLREFWTIFSGLRPEISSIASEPL